MRLLTLSVPINFFLDLLLETTESQQTANPRNTLLEQLPASPRLHRRFWVLMVALCWSTLRRHSQWRKEKGLHYSLLQCLPQLLPLQIRHALPLGREGYCTGCLKGSCPQGLPPSGCYHRCLRPPVIHEMLCTMALRAYAEPHKAVNATLKILYWQFCKLVVFRQLAEQV